MRPLLHVDITFASVCIPGYASENLRFFIFCIPGYANWPNFFRNFFFKFYHQIAYNGFLDDFYIIGNYFQSFFKKKIFFHVWSLFDAFSIFNFLSYHGNFFSFLDYKVVFTDTIIIKNNNNTIPPGLMDEDKQSDS